MENIGVLVFIDANCYLDFYRIPRGKSLLTFLLEQQDYIFITKQIVEEVQRNKLQEAKRFLTKLPEKLAEPDVPIPDHLLKIPGKTADNLHKTLEAIKQKIQSVKANLKKATVETLKAISSSEDEVSKALAPLFDRAVAHTPEEIHRARDRKERGNPPGKQKDSLGDQLTWEQLLSHCKGKFKLWVISKDSDYCIKHDDKRFLNPFLYEDLMRLSQTIQEVFCFDNLLKGIEDFVKVTGVKADQLPTAEESKEIKEELDTLPPLGWLPQGMDDANYIVLQNIQHARRYRAAFPSQ